MALRLPTIDDDGPVIAPRKVPLDNNLDMTPMIDVTFLLLIFFLVSSVPDVRAALDLPAAGHGVGVSRRQALVISVVPAADGRGVTVYLADGRLGDALPSGTEAQETLIHAAAEAAARVGTQQVLIKAEKNVRHRDVARLIRAASVDGISVNLAVMELD